MPVAVKKTYPPKLTLQGKTYKTDSWTNVSAAIQANLGANLHLQPSHPISITRKIIESQFPGDIYIPHNNLPPIVSTAQNFDSLGFPKDHPGRSKTDTYYVNENTVLRTHTSAHQLDTFRSNPTKGFLISADVYRRDAIDRSHYPIFHQMEGARWWKQTGTEAQLASEISKETESIRAKVADKVIIEDLKEEFNHERNPLQLGHSPVVVAAAASHLKRSLEAVVVELFTKARAAAGEAATTEPLKMRWIEAYFPFTSPSYELEIFWNDEWLEVLGCGIVQQDILHNASLSREHIGWAFGIGLERLAMVLFGIPDIRLFWSKDPRFLNQFKAGKVSPFQEFSKYPVCIKDVSFWAPEEGLHDNDVMEVIRATLGDIVESAVLVDEFVHPKTGRTSMCYRINYQSVEKTLRNRVVNRRHLELTAALKAELGVEIR
ncbi:hypothetical protein DFH27DRAFT_542500 [Peziza echinospora]|nr:hypothetical protein DFH27DRAFT_542500 [Peziza echinospora]